MRWWICLHSKRIQVHQSVVPRLLFTLLEKEQWNCQVWQMVPFSPNLVTRWIWEMQRKLWQYLMNGLFYSGENTHCNAVIKQLIRKAFERVQTTETQCVCAFVASELPRYQFNGIIWKTPPHNSSNQADLLLTVHTWKALTVLFLV